MKTVLFTFDYELFLGSRSGNVRECILDPTERLLALLQRYGFKGVFFVDTTYLMRLREAAEHYEGAARDLAGINEQLALLLRQGHGVFPHLHPHWLDAVYLPDRNEWKLENVRYYQFSSLPNEQQEDLFHRSLEIIYSLARPISEDYRADAYRAGGWSIQPFSHFRPRFLENGIYHEWSVIPGKYHFSDAHSFDFREAPADNPIYRFNDDPCLEDKSGPFTEWTISSLSMSPLEKWIDFKISGLLRRMGKRPLPKGNTVSSTVREEGDKYSDGKHRRIIASFEGLNPLTLKKYLAVIHRSAYFHFISHPKLITPYEFGMVEKLFRVLKRRYDIQTDFRKVLPE